MFHLIRSQTLSRMIYRSQGERQGKWFWWKKTRSNEF